MFTGLAVGCVNSTANCEQNQEDTKQILNWNLLGLWSQKRAFLEGLVFPHQFHLLYTLYQVQMHFTSEYT